jgi:hypothetical protein
VALPTRAPDYFVPAVASTSTVVLASRYKYRAKKSGDETHS